MLDFIGTFFAGWKAFFSCQGFAILPLYAALMAGTQRLLPDSGGDRPWISIVWRLGATYWAGFGLTFLTLGLPNTRLGIVFWANHHVLTLIGGLMAVYVGLSLSGLAWWERGEDGVREAWIDRLNPYLAVYLIGTGLAAAWFPPDSVYLNAAVLFSAVPAPWGRAWCFSPIICAACFCRLF